MELNHYKLLAMQVERRLIERRRILNGEISSSDQHTEQPQTPVETQTSLLNTSIEQSSLNHDTLSAVESLIDDSKTIQGDGDSVDRSDVSMHTECDSNTSAKLFIEQKIDDVPQLSLNLDSISYPYDFDGGMLSPSFSLHSSPSLDALNNSKNQSLYFTPLSGRETLTPKKTTDELQPGRLIRSNSYTIEKPSPLLIKHMEANGISLPTRNSSAAKSLLPVTARQPLNKATFSSTPKKQLKKSQTESLLNVTKETKIKQNGNKTPLTARKSLSTARSASTSSIGLQVTGKGLNLTRELKPKATATTVRKDLHQIGVFKNTETVLRSIYDTGSTARTTNRSKSASSAQSSTNTTKQKSKTPSPEANSSNQSTKPVEYKELLKMIESQHTAQMNALVKRQQEEQERMQKEFARQQEILLKQISGLISNQSDRSRTSTADDQSLNVTLNKSKQEPDTVIEVLDDNTSEISPSFDTNGNRINRFTPESAKCIRRLSYYDDNQLVAKEAHHKVLAQATPAEIKAATTIAAYTRGYLTRRLFKTVKVQNIVKTIRDTLLFILDIHFENNEKDSEADIKLKTHLIQQVMRRCSEKCEAKFIFNNLPIFIMMGGKKSIQWFSFLLFISLSS